MSIVIAFAAAFAAVAAFLQAILPGTWLPYLRAERAGDSARVTTAASLVVGRFGQAVMTSFVGLLVGVFALAIVGAADDKVQIWTGLFVLALSIVWFHRAFQRRAVEWEKIETFANPPAKTRPADPFGSCDESPTAVAGSMITSPGFLIAPMYIAAVGSGLPNVGNGTPVVLGFLIGTLAGLVWDLTRIRGRRYGDFARCAVERYDLLIAVLVAALGGITIAGA